MGRGGARKNFWTNGDQRLQKWPHHIYYMHIPPTPTMDTHIYTNTTYHTPIHRPHIPHVQAMSLQSCPLCATLWTVAHQASLSMGFSRQEYWSGLLCLLQGIFPTQGLNPHSYCAHTHTHHMHRPHTLCTHIPHT